METIQLWNKVKKNDKHEQQAVLHLTIYSFSILTFQKVEHIFIGRVSRTDYLGITNITMEMKNMFYSSNSKNDRS